MARHGITTAGGFSAAGVVFWSASFSRSIAQLVTPLSEHDRPHLRQVHRQILRFLAAHPAGKECPLTDSDLADFPARHFLTPPIGSLNRNSWAQVKFSSKRVLASASKGEALKDSYRVTGRSVIRLVTVEGNFDHEFPLDVSLDGIPF